MAWCVFDEKINKVVQSWVCLKAADVLHLYGLLLTSGTAPIVTGIL